MADFNEKITCRISGVSFVGPFADRLFAKRFVPVRIRLMIGSMAVLTRESNNTRETVFRVVLGIVAISWICGSGDQLVAETGPPLHPAWTTSQIQGTPEPPLPLRIERLFGELTFRQPIAVEAMPVGEGDSAGGRLLVLQRNGQILTLDPSLPNPQASLALDLQKIADLDGEKIASARDIVLDPEFLSNGFVYVAWSILPHLVEDGARISRFRLEFRHDFQPENDGLEGRSDDPEATKQVHSARSTSVPWIDPQSQLDIFKYPSGDHIGTSLAFGPDGLLYIALGDGSLPFPPDKFQTAQDLTDVRGSVLRIDVRDAQEPAASGRPYRIPSDNPFVNTPNARGEIFAFGIRNGFRSAFDPDDGQLWVADVGWQRCEMVHRIVKGGNHGWSLYEGPHVTNLEQVAGPGPRIAPAIAMERAEAQSITGGLFLGQNVRWTLVPESSKPVTVSAETTDGLPSNGDYLFGCFVNGNVWSARKAVTGEKDLTVTRVASTRLRLIEFFSFPLLNQGESSGLPIDAPDRDAVGMGVVDFGGGGLYRLVKRTRQELDGVSFPRRLSDTGLFVDLSSMRPNEGVVAYEPKATMFRNGLTGSRVVGVPTTQPIAPWAKRYPTGTVFANTLSREVLDDEGTTQNRKIETQILHYDGLNWNPYTYAWDAAQIDATLVPAEGRTIELKVDSPRLGPTRIPHVFASRAQCFTCHHKFHQDGASMLPENVAWDELAKSGYVEPRRANRNHPMADCYDDSNDLSVRARSYLHLNCAQCHRPGGGTISGLDLRRKTPDEKMNAIDVPPAQGDFGIGEEFARIIDPGFPERSTLVYRTATAGPGSMPKAGCGEVDVEGAKLLWEWVAAMPPMQDSTIAIDAASSPTVQAMKAWYATANLPAAEAVAAVSDSLQRDPDIILAGLLQPWTHPDQRREVVGTDPDVNAILSLSGDANRGRKWFAESSASQCRQCHRHGGLGQDIGPPLDQVARKWMPNQRTPQRRTPEQWLRQLTHPSETIDPRWQTETILSLDGEVVTGIVRRQSDEEIVIQQADGKSIVWLVDDIDSRQVNPKSMMPEGTIATMTAQEVADLLAFLITQPEQSK